MILTAPERIILLNLLPQKGDYAILLLGVDIQNEVNLTSEEVEKAGVTYGNGGVVTWNQAKAEALVKNITLNQSAKNLIRTQLSERDMKKELTPAQMSLYKKFVVDEKQEA